MKLPLWIFWSLVCAGLVLWFVQSVDAQADEVLPLRWLRTAAEHPLRSLGATLLLVWAVRPAAPADAASLEDEGPPRRPPSESQELLDPGAEQRNSGASLAPKTSPHGTLEMGARASIPPFLQLKDRVLECRREAGPES